MKRFLAAFLAIPFLLLTIAGCSEDDPVQFEEVPLYTISGKVYDENRVTGVQNIVVAIEGTRNETVMTNADGNYIFEELVETGPYRVFLNNPPDDYFPSEYTFDDLTESVTADFYKAVFANYVVSGTVLSAEGEPFVDAEVRLLTLLGEPVQNAFTGQDGFYRFGNIPKGNYLLRLIPPQSVQFLQTERSIFVNSNTQIDFRGLHAVTGKWGSSGGNISELLLQEYGGALDSVFLEFSGIDRFYQELYFNDGTQNEVRAGGYTSESSTEREGIFNVTLNDTLNNASWVGIYMLSENEAGRALEFEVVNTESDISAPNEKSGLGSSGKGQLNPRDANVQTYNSLN